ncbi:hypothetical protein AW736_17905 [Termitidicoccus mucosus]|uniref:Tyr recombinase domain-containing protein n=2 Tax=Termitidicoccus mucosus TaxID=1184151 RepID=A0A178IE09_9BACT|nr:hypothetical protein AW736_17855 [Opitutaceae bacterium TSB47]OAM88262.1 hypothetical protein AW736_17905 [Opitutaceae bacterium TSB47]
MAAMNTSGQPLPALVAGYLAHRRSFGFKLREDERLLRNFADFVATPAPGCRITAALATKWARQKPHEQNRRLTVIRAFTRYCSLLECDVEIPPRQLLGAYMVRRQPHLYTATQIRLMLQRCRKLSLLRSPLRAHTFETFFGLLACTGLRSGEACRLRLCDFDRGNKTLLVPATKFGPSRLLPLHPSVVRALADYQRMRQRLVPAGEHFFVGPRGRALCSSSISIAFAQIVRGIKSNGERLRPRPHDLRHTFATRWITEWSRQSMPLTHHLLRLSSYLGHRHLAATWWYVSAEAPAFKEASRRFARHRHGRSDYEA